ncbi:LuxR C-terminal-related transcriptional regulator [Lutimonas sp.]|uniref:LuxR C-terminal-related transcriptional regulator n=1 Tax=Lutimonas sp. TaxID=1872403 RepID=UPI003D9ABFC8
MKSFLQGVERELENRKGHSLDIESLQKIPLNNLESLYLFDFTQNQILFHKGFDQVFGYREKELDMDFIFDKYHPDDFAIIQNIVRELVVQMVDITIPEFSNILNISYRFRKKDGSYARILSNTIVYQTDDTDKVLNILIKYTDISFTHDSDAVEWMVDPTYIDMEKIKSEVYGEEQIFTPRELEVIAQIFEGRTNIEIAAILMISIHTVSTHRKNILFKSNCSDAAQLKLYCKRNGILTSSNSEVSK